MSKYELPIELSTSPDGTNSVSLVSSTDDRLVSWAYSRPNINEVDTVEFSDTVAIADFGINSMGQVTLAIQGSVLLRELLATFRGCSMWARTSRVLPIDETVVSSEYALMGPIAVGRSCSKIDHAIDEINDGVPQDKARLNLPITASTAFMFSADLRTMAVICKVLSKHAGEFGKYWSSRIWNACIEGEVSYPVDLDELRYDDKDLAIRSLSYNEETDSEYPYESVSAFGITTVKSKMSIGLAAQFARHQLNLFRSSIWSIAKLPMDVHGNYDMKSEIDVITTMPESSFWTMVTHRANYLADWGVWDSFVESATSHMTDEEFWGMLDHPDNYIGDNMERIRGTDPGTPDCRIIEDPYSLLLRRDQEGHTYISNRWLAAVGNGWVVDNPDNEYRKIWRSNAKLK